jgi:short-subunit dehydrogenase
MTPARRILVIGNSDGIGLALTTRLLAEGHVVTGVSRRDVQLGEATYEHIVLDVASTEYVEALRALIAQRGAFDACVYCAGVGELFNANDLSLEAQTFRVNLVGVADTVSVVLPAMLARGEGHIVAISSIGDGISAEAPSYAASKAGLTSYLGGLALALKPRGVHVSNVRLGFVDTKMAKSPVKPLMLSVERAVDVVMGCLARKPARTTHPWRMNVLVRLLDAVAKVKLWLG